MGNENYCLLLTYKAVEYFHVFESLIVSCLHKLVVLLTIIVTYMNDLRYQLRCIPASKLEMSWPSGTPTYTIEKTTDVYAFEHIFIAKNNMNKICTWCGDEKTIDSFHFKNKTKGQLRTICKICARNKSKQHYIANKNQYIDRAIQRTVHTRQFVRNLKYNLGCTICFENNPYCLVFHHLDPSTKELSVSRMIAQSHKKALREIEKCIVLCGNCHRKIHNNLVSIIKYKNISYEPVVKLLSPPKVYNVVKQRIYEVTKWYQQWKATQKCISCPEDTPICLDLHHANPRKKYLAVSFGVSRWSKSRLIVEINKCVILCNNCHMKGHHQ